MNSYPPDDSNASEKKAEIDKAAKAGCGTLNAAWFGGIFGFIIFILLGAPYYFGIVTGWIIGFLLYSWIQKKRTL